MVDKERFPAAMAETKYNELTGQLKFQELVTHISTKFINLTADEIDQAINDQFEEIAEYFNVARLLAIEWAVLKCLTLKYY